MAVQQSEEQAQQVGAWILSEGSIIWPRGELLLYVNEDEDGICDYADAFHSHCHDPHLSLVDAPNVTFDLYWVDILHLRLLRRLVLR